MAQHFRYFVCVANFIEVQRALSNGWSSESFTGNCLTAASLARGGQVSGGVIAGVPLEDDGGCATQTGELAVLGDAELRGGACEHGAAHLLLDDWAEACPGGGE